MGSQSETGPRYETAGQARAVTKTGYRKARDYRVFTRCHTKKRFAAVAAIVAILGFFAATEPAAAHTVGNGVSSETVDGTSWLVTDIGASENGYDAGDAYFLRTLDGDGTETLQVRIVSEADGGFIEASVCVGDTKFTTRANGQGNCEPPLKRVASDADQNEYLFTVDLGNTFIGKSIHVQVHVTLAQPDGGDTAFAGHIEDGPNFRGNVEVPYTPPSCPAGFVGGDDNNNGMIDEGECTPVTCPQGTVHVDANDNDIVDDGECEEPVSCPAGTTGMDTNGNNRIDEGECTEVEGQQFECPAGMVGSDLNGNGEVDNGECQTPTEPTPPGNPPVDNPPVDNPPEDTPRTIGPFPDAPAPLEVLPGEQVRTCPNNAAKVVTDLTDSDGDGIPDMCEAQVQGVVFQQPAPAAPAVAGVGLARTGADTTAALAFAGMLLVGLGLLLTTSSRKGVITLH